MATTAATQAATAARATARPPPAGPTKATAASRLPAGPREEMGSQMDMVKRFVAAAAAAVGTGAGGREEPPQKQYRPR